MVRSNQQVEGIPSATPDEARYGELWEKLAGSEVVREYRQAFACLTGLQLRLLPIPLSRDDGLQPCSFAPFCRALGRVEAGAELCRRRLTAAQRAAAARDCAVNLRCAAGVTEVMVPVCPGGKPLGTLKVGPFCLRTPNTRDLFELLDLLTDLEPKERRERFDRLLDTLCSLPVLGPRQSQAATTLARVFAEYISEHANQMLLRSARSRSPLLRKIEHLVTSPGGDDVPLGELARRVGVSPSYLCRLFKRETGHTLSEYRLRTRIEKAKLLLLNRHLRISEVAYEAGFDSIPYFNRVFRRHVGRSPSEYRAQQSPRLVIPNFPRLAAA